ncbi:MAG: cyclic nucleotide-binding domain-containing protein [Elusimicrobiota bacterium]|nr:cyclic nucleotide-binding domain-containing protein [Elusimicrobiota bacterium]
MRALEIGSAELGVLAGMMRKVEFFTPLTVGQLEKVLPAVLLYEYAPGEVVFKEGQKGDAFHIVYQGKVAVSIKSGFLGLSSKTVATLGPGAFFGEIALISDAPRTATVRCAEKTLLFTLVASDFQFVLAENPSAAAEMKRIADRRKFETSHQQR